MTTIKELIEKDVVFMGANWVEDSSATDSALPGYRYGGEIPCVNSSDLFYWGVADGVDIRNEDLPEFNQALIDCDNDYEVAGMLYCARKESMRPQGAIYRYIPKKLWPLFDACGPERKIDMFNPKRPGE